MGGIPSLPRGSSFGRATTASFPVGPAAASGRVPPCRQPSLWHWMAPGVHGMVLPQGSRAVGPRLEKSARTVYLRLSGRRDHLPRYVSRHLSPRLSPRNGHHSGLPSFFSTALSPASQQYCSIRRGSSPLGGSGLHRPTKSIFRLPIASGYSDAIPEF